MKASTPRVEIVSDLARVGWKRGTDGCAGGARGEALAGLHEGGGGGVGRAGEGGRGGVGTWPAATDLPAAVHVLNDDDVNMILPANSGPGV